MTARFRIFGLLALVLTLGLVIDLAGSLRAQPPAAVALSGRVSSAAEGPMEGVDVTARKAGSTMAITVITDERGQYHFPASYLTPGTYALTIRAAGYVLPKPAAAAVVAGKTTQRDLALGKTNDLEDQMSNGDWLASVPGTLEQKNNLLQCVDCHTLQRVVDSYHTAAEFKNIVLPRMVNYSNNSFWLLPQAFKTNRPRPPFPDDVAEYLASINQSSGPRKWPLKQLPRLKGASTHVIITEYDLPSRLVQPHDVILTPDGTVWYSDFGEQNMGELNPKTGQVTQYPVPALKPDGIKGELEIDQDPAGDLWLANMFQGQIDKFDPKTKTFTTYPVPAAEHPDFTQESMVMPVHDNVDGMVWTNNQDNHSFRGLDTKTGTFKSYGPYYYPDSTTHTFNAYGIVSDKANTLWLMDFGGTAIAHFNPAAGTFKIMPTPTALSRPRRGRVDDRTGIFWFAEYGANRIGMYDTKAGDDGTIKEFEMPTPFDSPYDVVADKNGNVWAGSMVTDRISMLNPATGQAIDYQLPHDTNTRRVWVDNSTSPVTFWTGNNHGASIVRLQQLP
ncbi:MAG: carboxypeptidase regulatory-like domain-containing protein [Candidatus Lustribacter sp.]|jgi:streptogramin lyase